MRAGNQPPSSWRQRTGNFWGALARGAQGGATLFRLNLEGNAFTVLPNTARVSATNDPRGVALVEIYEVP